MADNSAMEKKYIPPHRRNNNYSLNKFPSANRINNMKYNRTKNFSKVRYQGSKFNTRPISPLSKENFGETTEQFCVAKNPILKENIDILTEKIKPNIISPHEVSKNNNFKDIIEIPETIEPPTIDINQFKCNNITDIYEIKNMTKQPDSCNNKLITELFKINVERAKIQTEFDEWVDHYESELKNMYNNCIDENIELSYTLFVKLAYNCTATEFNRKKFKYSRPLI